MFKSFVNYVLTNSGDSIKRSDIYDIVKTELLKSGIGRSVVDNVIMNISNQLNGKKKASMKFLMQNITECLRSELGNIFGNKISEIFIEDTICNNIIITGANGVGKTSIVAKIATLAAQRNYKICVATIDDVRPGAEKQLEKLISSNDKIDILKLKDVFHTPQALCAMISNVTEKQNYDIFLLDTFGISSHKDAQRLREYLDKLEKAEVLHVIDAMHSSSKNILQTLSQEVIITGLILSKFDGAINLSGVIESKIDNLKPIYYYTFGEKNEDILPFSCSLLINRVISDIDMSYYKTFDMNEIEVKIPVVDFTDIIHYINVNKEKKLFNHINMVIAILSKDEVANPMKISYARKLEFANKIMEDISFIEKMILFYKKLSDKSKALGIFKRRELVYEELVN